MTSFLGNTCFFVFGVLEREYPAAVIRCPRYVIFVWTSWSLELALWPLLARKVKSATVSCFACFFWGPSHHEVIHMSSSNLIGSQSFVNLGSAADESLTWVSLCTSCSGVATPLEGECQPTFTLRMDGHGEKCICQINNWTKWYVD